MPIDSFIIKGYQGDEEELEQRLQAFLNSSPPKKISYMTSWTIGIEVYIMILYQVGKPVESVPQAYPKFTKSEDVSTYTGKGKGDY